MKAQLNQKEPQILEKWQKSDLYHKILSQRDPAKLYTLHDGPPYANGHIHLGTALNKILKDFVVKSKSMQGYYAPYTPGWDCHGLPIEIKVDRELGPRKHELSIIEVRDKCREYAEKFIDIQREEFVRLGVLGDWFNPYTTFNPLYESYIIQYFKSFVENNNVYRSKRPVYWCTSCKTALAEAEVEYENHTSPSIYVKFLLKDIPEFLQSYQNKPIYVLIWTTTPWTIPANLAIAVHPEFDYSLFEINGEYCIAANRLIPVLSDILNTHYKILTEFKGSELQGFNAIHPLYDRNSLIITADYVALDQGTGCVHTAPGHGQEDYLSGLANGLDVYSPVTDDGCFDHTTGKYEGKEIFSSNKLIVDDLTANHRLIKQELIEHSYPHCWRCKSPVIFRATAQWFIAMDKNNLRQNALQEIKKATWLPVWGEERISNMIENRPDWCISRQRDWGVPIPVFYCKKCHEPLLNTKVIEKVEQLFKSQGSNSWYTTAAEEIIPPNLSCSACGHKEFEKGMDIIDVWFESGASFGTLEQRSNHSFPADLYLEGGDQYRGWFHSSLLVGVRAKQQAPYKMVITHGWVLDDKGRAMSKSLGNVIEPQVIIKDKGAEILRLWVAMVNYREDVKLGAEILSRITESYRKIRNTWRFMLGVLADFDPDTQSVEDYKLRETDWYILAKLQTIKEKILDAYNKFEYHVVFHTLLNFFINDLSSFYLHFSKDNLYCNLPDSEQRRAAQTVILKLLQETLLLTAPILAFTAEEAWEYMPVYKNKLESVHMSVFPAMENHYIEKINQEKWQQIMVIRDNILKELEDARQNKKIIGDSLEASVQITANSSDAQLINNNLHLFKEILVISEIKAIAGETESIEISKFSGKKCPRCWNWFSQNIETTLCPRCEKVIKEKNIELIF
jgi:isoleucyl-tRNA synthetase